MQLVSWTGAVFSFEKISHIHADSAVQLALSHMHANSGSAPVANATPNAAATATASTADATTGAPIAVAVAVTAHDVVAYPSSYVAAVQQPGQQQPAVAAVPAGEQEGGVALQQNPVHACIEAMVAPPHASPTQALQAVPQLPVIGAMTSSPEGPSHRSQEGAAAKQPSAP